MNKHPLATTLCRALACVSLLATPALAKKLPASPNAPSSRAVSNEVVDEVAREMDRALQRLQIPGAPKPYYISYKLTEVEVNDVVATLGHTTSRRDRHFVSLEARVRVGSTKFDNGNYVVPGQDDIDGAAVISLPLEGNPRIARRAAWLVTDAAYKEALMQLRAKAEARKSGGGSDAPSWAILKPLVSEDEIAVPKLESVDELEARVQRLSSAFRDAGHIRDSRVAATSYLERRWYLTSEGTSVTDTRRASGILLSASAQADDGQPLHQYMLRYGHTAADLPTDEALKGEAKKLVELLGALRTAPMLEPYSGPVLFQGEGAVDFVRSTLAPHLGGTPLPEGLRPQDAKAFGGALADKVGLRVTSPFITIVDDPTASTAAGSALIGGYKIDDEGTPAEKVTVIKDGVLKSLLTSRIPTATGKPSNGHARRSAEGGAFHGSATNLIVSGKSGLPRAALVKKLIGLAKAEGLGYGVIVRRSDDAAITSAPEFSRRELLNLLQTTDQDLPPPAILAYRVDGSGKETLVRGAQLAEVPIRAWKDIVAIGNTPIVYNFLAPSDSVIALRINGGTENGNVPSGGIESSVTTPDLLVNELELRPLNTGKRAAPAVAAPTGK